MEPISKSINDIINTFRIIEPLFYTTNEFNSTKHGLISTIAYPKMWNFTPDGVGFEINSPRESDSDNYTESIFMTISVSDLNGIEDFNSQYVNSLKGNFTDFELIDSRSNVLSNNSAHQIIFTYKDLYCECDLEVLSIVTILHKRVYHIEFIAEEDKFSTYLPTVRSILNSIEIHEKASVNIVNKTGLRLSGSPIDLAINPTTNRIYVAIPEARQNTSN
jgi:hypothetical protein